MPSPTDPGGSGVATSLESSTTLARELGLFDSTMMVAGSMIGSGIFLVTPDIARHTGAAGWLLLTWVITGLLTIAGALSYGELAARWPRAGGQYVYLREAFSPLWGFLFGWTFFLVIQAGSIAAVAIGFARYLGVLVPAISPNIWIIRPVHLSEGYAISLSVQQLAAIGSIALLTWLNTRGLRLGKWIQNLFTSAKTIGLVALIAVGILAGRNADAIGANFSDPWTPRSVQNVVPDLPLLPALSAATGFAGLLVALAVAQVGSLFAADAWNNVTFTSEEVKNPQRNLPLALAGGAALVIVLYLLANVAYLVSLPMQAIQQAPDDCVASAALAVVCGDAGAILMAAAIVISTFGCNNGLIIAGARVGYAMARDGLFFRAAGRLNRYRVPAVALTVQGIWACLLVLPRTRLRDPQGKPILDPGSGLEQYGNLYSNLLDYVVSAVLIFYVLTIIGLFVLRRRRQEAATTAAGPSLYRAWGYPVVPALYVLAATALVVVLLLYRTRTTWPGLLIVLTGIPVYAWWRRFAREGPASGRG